MEVGEFTPRPKSSNRDYCAVKGCESNAAKNSSVSFHRFPRPNGRFVNRQNIFDNSEKIDLFKAWKISLKITNITKRTTVCSRHFLKSDYFFPDAHSSRRLLKKDAVPSCYLPGDKRKKVNEIRDKARWQRRMRRSNMNENVTISIKKSSKASVKTAVEQIISVSEEQHNSNEQENQNHENNAEINGSIEKPGEQVVCEMQESEVQDVSAEENQIDDAELDATQQFLKDMFVKPSSPEPLVKHQGVQVNTDCLVPSIMKSIHSDQQLSTMTGLESLKLLDTIVEIVKKVSDNKFERLNIIMNTRERVILTYVKLKQNVSYSFLAALFNCHTATHCQRIFHETIKILSKCLKAAIPWPSKEEISKNIPACFQGFENVRVVVDCKEINKQRPANLCCQVITYSHYKGGPTFKIMTADNITYVSPVYGGRASDSAIFQQSRLMQLLEPGDGVMVDRGFLIDEICAVNQWQCIRPPFLKEKKQFTKEESLLTANIATARVHVERSNQRIKTFKIVGTVMPAALLPLAEDIFTIICGTINMTAPIINDEKFMNIQ